MYFPGVVWHISNPIEGGFESLAILQKLGKKIYLVTNNSANKDQTLCDRARCACLYLTPVSMQCLFFYFFDLSNNYFICIHGI